MKNFDLVCVDMFQTLVDVNNRCLEAGKRMLKDRYTPKLAEEYWREASKLILDYFGKQETEEGSFCTTRQGFEVCYRKLWEKENLDIDPAESADILAREHSFASVYEDAEVFVEMASRHYPLCLVSDADEDMIFPLLIRFPFDHVLISERCRSYKRESKMFEEVIRHYRMDPERILHIGDGYSDIAGAARTGIKTCWLNRNRAEWRYEIKSDYTVTSLLEVLPILGIEL